MRAAILTIAMIAGTAHAGQFEASLGKTYLTAQLSYSIGYDFETFNVPVRIGYANLGTPIMNPNVSPEDYADDNAAGWGGPPCHWLAARVIKEAYFTADPALFRGDGYTVSAELGAALYHSQWQQDICQKWQNEAPHNYHNPPNVTPILGLVISNGGTDFALSWQDTTGRGDWEGDNPRSAMVNFSIRKRF